MSRRSFPSTLSASLLDADTPLGLLEPMVPSKSIPVLPKVLEKTSPSPPPIINLLDDAVSATVPIRIHRFLNHSSELIVPEAPAQATEAFSDTFNNSSSSDLAITVSDDMNLVETRGLNAVPNLMDLAPDNIVSSAPALTSTSMAYDIEMAESLGLVNVPSFHANFAPAASSSLLSPDQRVKHTNSYESLSTNHRAGQFPTDLRDWLKICPCNLKAHPCPKHTSCTHQHVCFDQAFNPCKCRLLHILPTCEIKRAVDDFRIQVNGYPYNFGHDNAEGRCLGETLEEEYHGLKFGKYIERFKEPEASKMDVENGIEKGNEKGKENGVPNGVPNGSPAVQLKGIEEADMAVPGVENGEGTGAVAEDREDTTDPRKTDFSFEGEHEVFKARSWRAYYERQDKLSLGRKRRDIAVPQRTVVSRS